jgi:hypothetical protein
MSVRREERFQGELCGEEHQFFGAKYYAAGTKLLPRYDEQVARIGGGALFFARSVLHSNRLVGEPD